MSVLDAFAPPAWSRCARLTEWGCVAWAGEEATVFTDWLVLGVPSADPWGWPGRRLPIEELAARLSSLGMEAVRTAAGPFLVLNLRDGSVTRPSNGLVPFWEGHAGGSTSRELTGPNARELAPLSNTGYERNARTLLKGKRVRVELLEHGPPATCASEVCLPGPRDPVWGSGAKAVARLRELRDEAARSWWAGRLAGRWVHSPVLERPAVDRLLEAGS